jgi:hypothetical protein
MTNAETRVLRFLQASRTKWTPAKVILNTEDLLPGDEKALAGLVRQGLALALDDVSGTSYRVSEAGVRALGRTKGKDH